MGDAAKVIHWNGTDVPTTLAEALKGLPPGDYRLEAVADATDADEGFELTAEEEEGIEAGLRSARDGRVVSLDEAHARMTARLSALR